MINECKAASIWLKSNPGVLSQVRKLSVFSVAGGFKKYQNFHDTLEKNGIPLPLMQHVIYVNRFSQTHFLILGTEEEVALKISSLKAPVVNHVPTPDSVLVKMIAARLGKIHDTIKGLNTGQRHVLIPELTESDLFDDFQKYSANPWLKQNHQISQIRELIHGRKISEEVLKKAWGIYSVKAVMES